MFILYFFNHSILYYALEIYKNIEIAKLIMTHPNFDINGVYILIYNLYINDILNYVIFNLFSFEFYD